MHPSWAKFFKGRPVGKESVRLLPPSLILLSLLVELNPHQQRLRLFFFHCPIDWACVELPLPPPKAIYRPGICIGQEILLQLTFLAIDLFQSFVAVPLTVRTAIQVRCFPAYYSAERLATGRGSPTSLQSEDKSSKILPEVILFWSLSTTAYRLPLTSSSKKAPRWGQKHEIPLVISQ